MRNRRIQFISRYFGHDLDFRVRLFNVLAMGGTVISFAMVLVGIAIDAGMGNIGGNFISVILSYGLLRYSQRTGRYQLCYFITIIAIFMVLFPVLFFTAGGYHSGMSSFFVFAVAFTILMLEGKRAIAVSFAEVILYLSICIIAFRHPELVNPWEREQDLLTDVIVGFVSVSVVLGTMLYFHFKLYNEQQKQLAEQNILLSQLNRMKTELFANISHELKTPLTVISVHAQRAEALLELGRDGDLEKIHESHALVYDEAMRLSRLVDSTLRLAFLQEAGERKTTQDICSILRTTAEAYRSLLEKKGNTLLLSLPETPLLVYGHADQLVQLISNLLSNAGAHTKQGHIHISAEQQDEEIVFHITDTGTGIALELLSRIFERGITDGGGSGLGLSICLQIAHDHCGEIMIDSVQGEGTRVKVKLPLYREEGSYAES
ncbi:HAMP domain-containing histidine kinase [Aminipila butyrica]|uniref:histidine kinase n=1 Tax=Aminipila butyrica TaxID=433296 RepID=A0A858BTD9_9FIRM|nr:HAMP domain-containing sensor histidine kinase [Aminipila butyrica]QIB68827.1 HAMP domain-containing histidine kinase [Aminipila butyrica]